MLRPNGLEVKRFPCNPINGVDVVKAIDLVALSSGRDVKVRDGKLCCAFTIYIHTYKQILTEENSNNAFEEFSWIMLSPLLRAVLLAKSQSKLFLFRYACTVSF